MKLVRFFGGSAALVALVTVALVYTQTPVQSFDIKESPATIARPAADITDVYFFPSPTNSNNVVAVMDVYPLAPTGAAATQTFFDNTVLYTMKFDNKYASEAVGSRPTENLEIQFSMGKPSGTTGNLAQQVLVYGPGTPVTTGTAIKLLNGGQAAATGLVNKPFSAGSGITVFAGVREDPFFFNLSQFYNILPDRNMGSTSPSCLPGVGNGTCPTGFGSTGTDAFAGQNVLSIVIELPRSTLQVGQNGTSLAYWATTSTTSGK